MRFLFRAALRLVQRGSSPPLATSPPCAIPPPSSPHGRSRWRTRLRLHLERVWDMAWKFAKNRKAATTRTDIYQNITDDVIAMLEAGTRPWSPSWSDSTGVPLRHCGTAYKGIKIGGEHD